MRDQTQETPPAQPLLVQYWPGTKIRKITVTKPDDFDTTQRLVMTHHTEFGVERTKTQVIDNQNGTYKPDGLSQLLDEDGVVVASYTFKDGVKITEARLDKVLGVVVKTHLVSATQQEVHWIDPDDQHTVLQRHMIDLQPDGSIKRAGYDGVTGDLLWTGTTVTVQDADGRKRLTQRVAKSDDGKNVLLEGEITLLKTDGAELQLEYSRDDPALPPAVSIIRNLEGKIVSQRDPLSYIETIYEADGVTPKKLLSITIDPNTHLTSIEMFEKRADGTILDFEINVGQTGEVTNAVAAMQEAEQQGEDLSPALAHILIKLNGPDNRRVGNYLDKDTRTGLHQDYNYNIRGVQVGRQVSQQRDENGVLFLVEEELDDNGQSLSERKTDVTDPAHPVLHFSAATTDDPKTKVRTHKTYERTDAGEIETEERTDPLTKNVERVWKNLTTGARIETKYTPHGQPIGIHTQFERDPATGKEYLRFEHHYGFEKPGWSFEYAPDKTILSQEHRDPDKNNLLSRETFDPTTGLRKKKETFHANGKPATVEDENGFVTFDKKGGLASVKKAGASMSENVQMEKRLTRMRVLDVGKKIAMFFVANSQSIGDKLTEKTGYHWNAPQDRSALGLQQLAAMRLPKDVKPVQPERPIDLDDEDDDTSLAQQGITANSITADQRNAAPARGATPASSAAPTR